MNIRDDWNRAAKPESVEAIKNMLSLKQLRQIKAKQMMHAAPVKLFDEGWHVRVWLYYKFEGIARYSEVLEVFGRYQ